PFAPAGTAQGWPAPAAAAEVNDPRQWQAQRQPTSEIPLLLLLLHGARLVMVDEAALALGHLRRQRLGHHAVEIGGVGQGSRGQRPAAERAEADAARLRRLAGPQRHA